MDRYMPKPTESFWGMHIVSTAQMRDMRALSGYDKPKIKKAYEDLVEMMYALDMTLGRVLSDSKTTDPDNFGRHKGRYNNIPFSYQFFINQLTSLVEKFYPKKKHITFLDVGCGIGLKCYLAKMLGLDPTGLEVNEKYAKVAEGFEIFDVVREDALLSEIYNKFDIIYWYTPIADSEKMTELMDRIRKKAKKGCVLWPVGWERNQWSNADYKDVEERKVGGESFFVKL